MTEEYEKEFLDRVQKFLESKGVTVYREVVPDDCIKWTNPLHADMIIFREDIGYIGLEGKDLKTLGQGAVFAKAFEQIKKYKDFTYLNGTEINKWAIIVNFNTFLDKQSDSRTLEFIRCFFRHYNIYIAEFRDNNDFSIGYGFPGSLRFNDKQNGLKNVE